MHQGEREVKQEQRSSDEGGEDTVVAQYEVLEISNIEVNLNHHFF